MAEPVFILSSSYCLGSDRTTIFTQNLSTLHIVSKMESTKFPVPTLINGDFYKTLKIKQVRVIDNSKASTLVEEVASVDDESIRKAVKKITLFDSEGQPKNMQFLAAELTVMHVSKHPHVMNMESFAACDNFLAVTMPFCSRGSLGGMLESLEPEQTERYFVQITCALRYLHDLDVVHGDVKPGNILVDASDNAILADFGHAKILTGGQEVGSRWGGTRGFIGPEFYTSESINFYMVSTFPCVYIISTVNLSLYVSSCVSQFVILWKDIEYFIRHSDTHSCK